MSESIEALKEMLEAEKKARIQAEEKYLQSLDFVSKTKNNIPGILYIFDIILNKNVYSNQRINYILGYTVEEISAFGSSFTSTIIHPDDRIRLQEHRQRLTNASAGEELDMEYRVQHKSGEWKWLLSRESILSRNKNGAVQEIIGSAIDISEHKSIKRITNESGRIIRLQSSSRNITERKKAEAALEKSEKKYRDLVSYSQVIIFTHTLDGIILSTNPIMQHLLGYSEMEMAGRPFSELLLARDRIRYKDYLKDIRQRNKVVGVVTVLDKQGQQKHLLYHNIKVDEPEVEPYIIAFAQDITERLEAENELKMAKDKAEESAKYKELFLANMSHEIRTPMNGILGMAALLKKTTLEPTQKNYLNLIQESAQNLLVIINDVLDIAKIESGKLQFEKIPFNVNDILHSAQQSLIYKAEEKDILLHLKPLKIANPMVNGDPYRLTQILINLLSNAIKFTEVGKVELAAEVTAESISDYTVRISVTDTGIGIAPDKLDGIFESFVQAQTDTTRKYGGTGLGLTICKNLIEMQGGRIWAKSKPGDGATFTFEITYPKVHLTQALPDSNTLAIDYTSLSSLKVLLAEDNAINQFMAESILNGWGMSVDIANDGLEAIALHEKQNYDVILMDIQMPGMGGVEATRLIRKMPDPVKAKIPIIALTANALKGDSDIYLEAGMNDYMSKPYEEEKLFLKISHNIRTKRAVSTSTNMHSATEVTSGPVKHLYNLALVEKLAKGDQTFITKMIEMFITLIPESITQMQAHVASGNWLQLGQVVHSIKPAVDTLMISAIREQLIEIENSAKNNQNLNQLPQLVSDTTQTLQDIIIELKGEFQM